LMGALPDHLELHPRGQHGQIFQTPFLQFLIIVFRFGQGYQVSQGPGNYILLPFQVAFGLMATF